MSRNDREELEMSYINLDKDGDNELNEVILQRNSEKSEEIVAMKDVDIKETYLKLIFEPYRFAKSTICKSLSVI